MVDADAYGTGVLNVDNDACDSPEEVVAMVKGGNPGAEVVRDLTGEDLEDFIATVLRHRPGHRALDMDRVLVFAGKGYFTAWVWAFKDGCAVGDEHLMIQVRGPGPVKGMAI